MGIKLITTDHITGEGLDGARIEIDTEYSNGFIDLTQDELIKFAAQLNEACDGENEQETASSCTIDIVSASACYFTDCLDQYKEECLNGRAWKTCKNRKAER